MNDHVDAVASTGRKSAPIPGFESADQESQIGLIGKRARNRHISQYNSIVDKCTETFC